MEELFLKIAKVQKSLEDIASHLVAGNVIPAVNKIMSSPGYGTGWILSVSGTVSQVEHETNRASSVVTNHLLLAQVILQRDHDNPRRFVALAIVEIRKAQLALDELVVHIHNWVKI